VKGAGGRGPGARGVALAICLAGTIAAAQLPPGVTVLHSEMVVESELSGAPGGSTLRMAADFSGRAAVVAKGKHVRLHDFSIEGNRAAREQRDGLPPSNMPFAKFTTGNGILAEGAAGLTVERVTMREIGGFAVLVAASSDVTIDGVKVSDSGSRDAAGKNNTTGGILLEEGTSDFRVTNCDLRGIRGNGVWTHSLYTSARNARGVFRGNTFDTIGRDALQAGHAVAVRIEGNSGRAIGYPKEIVDATPVAIDTAGNVERSVYTKNRFEDMNGKCIDLDGFHDGDVSENTCVKVGGYGIVFNNTNPDMQSTGIRVVGNVVDGALYGGIFVIGSGNTIAKNRLLNLNTSHCEKCWESPGQPGMLESGIYLGKQAERPAPARGNTVEGNEITGYKMKARCVASAPGVGPNLVRANRCRD
jgi:hypothetical protein